MIELNRHKLSLSYSSYHPADDQTYPLRFAFCKQALEAATGERQRASTVMIVGSPRSVVAHEVANRDALRGDGAGYRHSHHAPPLRSFVVAFAAAYTDF